MTWFILGISVLTAALSDCVRVRHPHITTRDYSLVFFAIGYALLFASLLVCCVVKWLQGGSL